MYQLIIKYLTKVLGQVSVSDNTLYFSLRDFLIDYILVKIEQRATLEVILEPGKQVGIQIKTNSESGSILIQEYNNGIIIENPLFSHEQGKTVQFNISNWIFLL